MLYLLWGKPHNLRSEINKFLWTDEGENNKCNNEKKHCIKIIC